MAIDWQFSIGDLEMGPGTPYIVTDIQGLPGKDEIRVADIPRALEHGYDLASDLVGSRHVTLEFYIDGAGDPVTTKPLIDAVVAEWFIDDTDAEPLKPLTFQIPGSPEQVIFGRPRKSTSPLDMLKSGKGTALLEYVAGDPFIYSAELHTQAMALQTITTGRTYPRVYPLTYGAGTALSTPITNAGTIPARPSARIIGPCANPVLENLDTGEMLAIDIVLAATDFLDLDFAAFMVLLNGSGSRYIDKDPSSTWWRLAPGTTNVRFRADAFTPGAVCAFSWRDTWL